MFSCDMTILNLDQGLANNDTGAKSRTLCFCMARVLRMVFTF